KSRPSSALFRISCRVSLPDFGAYSTPTTAPMPSPARNQAKPLPPSSRDISSSWGSDQTNDGTTPGRLRSAQRDRGEILQIADCGIAYFVGCCRWACYGGLNLRLPDLQFAIQPGSSGRAMI